MNGLASQCATALASIRHRRFQPKPHHFYASLNYLWFDPDHIQATCQKSRLWSFNRWNTLSIHEQDYLNHCVGSIRDKVHQHLAQEANYHLQSSDQVRVLSLPRSLGFGFNSVIFYFIWSGDTLLFILSEITNTPWKQRHTYTHDCRNTSHIKRPHSTSYPFTFNKAFHVSPFMPMDITYHWNFTLQADQVWIEMRLLQDQKMIFDASMQCKLVPMNHARQQARYALGFPLQGFKMLAMIHLQALRLWLKKIPFYPHPHKSNQGDKAS